MLRDIDGLGSVSVQIPEGFREAFREIAKERTDAERHRTGRKTRDTIVTVRALQEEALVDFGRDFDAGHTPNMAGTRDRGRRHLFNLSPQAAELLREIAHAAHAPHSAVFLTACLRFLTKHTHKEWT